MKKILLALSLLAALSTESFAQLTGGGSREEGSKSSRSSSGGKSILDRKFYLRFGLNMPVGKYGADISPLWPVNYHQGMSGSTGPALSIGNYFYVTPLIADMLKVGIDWSYLNFTYNKSKFSDLDNALLTYSDMSYFTYSMKIGPVVSWSMIDNLAVDAFLRAAPTVVIAGGAEVTDPLVGYPEEVMSPSAGFGVKTNFGVTARYGVGSLTLAADVGSIKMNYDYDYTSGNFMDRKLSQSAIMLMLGLQL